MYRKIACDGWLIQKRGGCENDSRITIEEQQVWIQERSPTPGFETPKFSIFGPSLICLCFILPCFTQYTISYFRSTIFHNSNLKNFHPHFTRHWRIYIVKFWRPPGSKFFLISCSFSEILAKSYVGTPPPRRDGAPTSKKSWIRHCSVYHFSTNQ